MARLHPFCLLLASKTTTVQTVAVTLTWTASRDDQEIQLLPVETTCQIKLLFLPWYSLLSNLSSSLRSVGAVATLLDASCATKTEFPIFLQTLFDTWNATDSTSLTPPSNLMSILMGQHYFQNSSPVWDFRIKGGMASGNSNAFVVGNKTNNAPSPLGPGNADWLKLNGTLGALAREVCILF